MSVEGDNKIEEMIIEKNLNAPRLTPDDIDSKIKSKEFIMTSSGKTMICEITLENGFTVRGESSCVDPLNFDKEIGEKISFENARDQVWLLEGYLLQEALYKNLPVARGENMKFGDALIYLGYGAKLARKGWNGSGIFIQQQNPDENSKMSGSYLFIDTTGLNSENPDAPRKRVPWAPSQTDLLSRDWYVVK